MTEILLRAFLAGSAVAVVAGPVGAVVIWRKLAYFGSAVSHSALLGVALGLAIGLDITLAVTIFCISAALLLVPLRRLSALPSDSLIGIIAEVTLAGGLVAVGFVKNLRVDLIGYLFGDVLAVTPGEIGVIAGVAAGVLLVLVLQWRRLLSLTVHPELAQVEGVPVRLTETLFMILVAVVVAAGMRIVGILLIVSLLIIPAAAARRLSSTPEMMAIVGAFLGVAAVAGGLLLSLHYDMQAGPAIVLVAGALFATSLLLPSPNEVNRSGGP